MVTKTPSSGKSLSIDIERIMTMIPHRYPFLLLDRVTDYVLGESIQAYKNITFNELSIDWKGDVIIVEGVFDAMKAGNAVIIRLPNGEGWLLQSKTNNLEIEKNIFLGNKNKIINNESIFISEKMSEEIILLKWEIERVK